ncbi:hypothetical protein BLOT_005838 [Blomia tropicalis]|nr:hypothetical protein BLOT_005838 [Blomia tropicalis]
MTQNRISGMKLLNNGEILKTKRRKEKFFRNTHNLIRNLNKILLENVYYVTKSISNCRLWSRHD